MRVTDKADRVPKACAVSGREDGPFIDFQVGLDLPKHEPYNLFLHKLIVEDAARKLGMVKGEEVKALEDKLAELTAELADVQDTMKLAAELEEKLGPDRERIPA